MLVDTRLVDEALHVLHQLVVRIVLVRDPVLERVVVDGSDVPRRRLELCLIQHVLPARSDAVRKEAGRVVGLREAVTHGSEEGWCVRSTARSRAKMVSEKGNREWRRK